MLYLCCDKMVGCSIRTINRIEPNSQKIATGSSEFFWTGTCTGWGRPLVFAKGKRLEVSTSPCCFRAPPAPEGWSRHLVQPSAPPRTL